MFRKHPLRDVMLLLLIGITLTFTFNLQAVDTGNQENPVPVSKPWPGQD